MNTSALKSFAPAVRRELIEAVGRKLDVVLAAQTPDYRTTFAPQVTALRELVRVDRTGLIEKVAYTWFNRLTALRYLDARGWHPFRARVLTSADAGSTQPELLKLARDGALPDELKPHTDSVRLDGLLDGKLPSPNPQGEVYRHLVLASCRFYHSLLPDVFERLDDATELLLPDDLLTEQSVAQRFRTEITDEDCADVEIIGWLYQFYISERKNQVMARKSAVPTEDIPAVTQLFTPHWIVRYLVENSLGRLWLLNRPDSRLRDHMPYYIEGDAEIDFLKITKAEDIRVCDPAVGSGHMLTYAFDLLTLIYEEEGYAPNDIPALILQRNLVGIDIDARAAQLAELALVFKAREKSSRFFQPDCLIQPHVIAVRDVRFESGELEEYVHALHLGPLFDRPVIELLSQFEQATTFGALIQPVLGAAAIANLRQAIYAADVGGQLLLSATHEKVIQALDQAEYLAERYHAVVANPPYMGSKGMNGPLRAFVNQHYPEGSPDLMTAFILRGKTLLLERGLLGVVTLDGWMFLSSFISFRSALLQEYRFATVAYIGWNCFPEGHTYNRGVACLWINSSERAGAGRYLNLSDVPATVDKESLFLQRLASGTGLYVVDQSHFAKLPDSIIAFSLSDRLRHAFESGIALGDIASPRQGLATGDNSTFLRMWHEVGVSNIGFRIASREEAVSSGKTWFPYNKGGEFRRWYGNQRFVIDWAHDGERVRNFCDINGKPRSVIRNADRYFQPCISWSKVTSSLPAFRSFPAGFIFDVAGTSIFSDDPSTLASLLAFTNSIVARQILGVLSPTLNLEVGHIKALPLMCGPVDQNAIRGIAALVEIARDDWNGLETSWEFQGAPLLRSEVREPTVEKSFHKLMEFRTGAIARTKALEEENNRHWIAAYGLPDELNPEVREEEITLIRSDRQRDAAALLSYAVGCVMGRYSLDKQGMILADTGDTLREFLAKVGRPQSRLTFTPDEDGVIPVLDGEWFKDDIVARTHDFLRAAFGEATLRENLRFIEDSLGKDLRKYFLTDFYKDHLQIYKKRPIYWMLQSPRKGFSALVYLHRYTRDTLNVVLNRYLREYTVRLRSRQTQLTQSLAGESLPAAERTSARKESERIVKVLHECEEWERDSLLPLAQQRVELDLDDGVKVNYLKLADVLAPIPGLAAAEE